MKDEVLNRINASLNSSSINLANRDIADREIQEIIDKIFELNPGIAKFNFDKNNLGDQGAQILGQSLLQFSNLTELSVQFNRIDKAGALALFALKNEFPKLDIAFRGNKILNDDEMFEIERSAMHQASHLKSPFQP